MQQLLDRLEARERLECEIATVRTELEVTEESICALHSTLCTAEETLVCV